MRPGNGFSLIICFGVGQMRNVYLFQEWFEMTLQLQIADMLAYWEDLHNPKSQVLLDTQAFR